VRNFSAQFSQFIKDAFGKNYSEVLFVLLLRIRGRACTTNYYAHYYYYSYYYNNSNYYYTKRYDYNC